MRLRDPRVIATMLGLVALSMPVDAATWTVDDDGPADFAVIQAAIDAAQPGDIVEVRPGNYPENLTVKCGVAVRGAGPDLVTVDGRQSGPVAAITGCGEGTVLEGLRIHNGRSDFGAGVLIQGGAPVVRGNAIVGNRAVDWTGLLAGYGGGVGLLGSSASIVDNLIDGNEADYGGGLEIFDGAPQIRGNTIRLNTAAVSGGGVDAYLTAVQTTTIHGNRILANSASYGGGIEIFGPGRAVIAGNLLAGNAAVDPNDGHGGGIDVFEGEVRIVANTVADNQAVAGGGMALRTSAASEMSGNIVARNQALLGGALDLDAPLAQVRFNILHAGAGNACGGADLALCDDPSNLQSDPLFVDPDGGDYRLQAGSPAIDSAPADPLASPDLRGQLRPLDGDGDGTAEYDRGAFEFDRDAVLFIEFAGAETLVWRAQEGAGSYRVYSGALSALRVLGTDACRAADDPDPGDLLFTDPTVPPVGDGLAYNVTAVIGGLERSAGFDSAGLERTLTNACP